MRLERIDAVLPVYNEAASVREAFAALQVAAERAQIAARLIVVDDGSDEADAAALRDLARDERVLLVRQPNSGRFAARRNGMGHVSADHVLLVDSRVRIEPDSLAEVRRRVEAGEGDVWNYDVHLANPESPWASFWFGITAVWWRDYFTDRRDVVLDAETFDRFPKGTGAFFAPRADLAQAMEMFTTHFDDVSLASDDTGMLKHLARTRGIHLSPAIRCRYYGKDTPSKWARQCYFRGTTFVDGYLPGPGWAAPLLAAVAVAGAAAAAVAVRRPTWLLAGAALGSLAAGAAARRCGATGRESVSVAALTVPFGALFGAGVVRGLGLAVRTAPDRS